MMTTAELASDLQRALDPAAFAESIGFDLDPWQQQFVRSESKQVILAAGRQVGKSAACSLVAAHTAIYEPGSLIVLAAPALRQSTELTARTRDVLRHAGEKDTQQESTQRITLRNGSRIVSLPGSADTVRGLSGVRLIVIDEAGFLAESVFASLMPMLAANPRGRLILASSPNGRGGFFSDQWHDGGESWQRFHVRSEDCPRIDKAFLERQRLALTEAQYRQEYQASFEDSAGAVFSSDDIARLHLEGVEAWEL